PQPDNSRRPPIDHRVDSDFLRPCIQPQSIWIWLRRRPVSWLIDEPCITKARPAPARIDRLQKIGSAQAMLRHAVPEDLIACCPQQPSIAALHLIIRKSNASIHRVEGARRGFRKVSRCLSRCLGVIRHHVRTSIPMKQCYGAGDEKDDYREVESPLHGSFRRFL